MLLHYDMASMAFGAEAIVLVEEPAYSCGDVSYERGQARGARNPSASVQSWRPRVAGHPTQLQPSPLWWGSEYPRDLALLFLVRGRATQEEFVPLSGVKLINQKGVFRFVQRVNPDRISPDLMRRN